MNYQLCINLKRKKKGSMKMKEKVVDKIGVLMPCRQSGGSIVEFG